MEQLSYKPKFKVGDKVRITKYKRKILDKSYTPNWTEEMFLVDKIQSTNPITYRLKDLHNEEIQGSFYESALIKSFKEIQKKQALVSWNLIPLSSFARFI